MSASKSPAATPVAPDSARTGAPSGRKLPSPWPSTTVTLLDAWFAAARSGRPSKLKSAGGETDRAVACRDRRGRREAATGLLEQHADRVGAAGGDREVRARVGVEVGDDHPNGCPPTDTFGAATNVSPGPPNRTDALAEPLFESTRSRSPSPLSVGRDRGARIAPAAREVGGREEVGADAVAQQDRNVRRRAVRRGPGASSALKSPTATELTSGVWGRRRARVEREAAARVAQEHARRGPVRNPSATSGQPSPLKSAAAPYPPPPAPPNPVGVPSSANPPRRAAEQHRGGVGVAVERRRRRRARLC